MTREELIQKAANNYHRKAGEQYGFYDGAKWADDNRWISVEDELPEIDVEHPSYSISVIVIDHYGDWNKGYWSFNDELWIAENYGSVPEITHWMPLPEPPKI